MKNLFSWLSSLALVSAFILGTATLEARADHDSRADSKKSPLRGTFSFSQFVPATTGLGTPAPIPTASAGILVMDDNNNFTGHAVLDTPLPVANPTFELDFQGSCTFRQGDVKNGMDCHLDVPAFGLTNVGRFCVAMAGRGACFDEFRCVDTNEPGSVVLVEFKRQHPGSCQ